MGELCQNWERLVSASVWLAVGGDWIEIEIVNWEKYNPKRDQKTYTWLRLDNGIITDPDLFGLSAEQKMIWVALLCEASKKNAARIRVNMGWLEKNLDTKHAKILETLAHLQLKPMIIVVTAGYDRPLPPASAVTTPTNERTNDTDVTNERTVQVSKGTTAAKEPSKTGPVWEKYKKAFEGRYGEPPPWNAKTAGQLKQLIARISQAEAPEVAAFYLTHTDAKYARAMHPVGLLLMDAEKLRTEWATGRRVSGAQVAQAEKQDSNVQAMKSYLAGKGSA